MGKLFVVGIGSGNPDQLTEEACLALSSAELICGYTAYVEQVAPMYPEKKTYTSGMLHEVDRCRRALSEAQNGCTVAMVCSGDAGVYGMAAPILELLPEYRGVEVRIVAGVTAALSGAAVLGAPLGHDFCVISLSDLLTPWAVIEKRLRCAGEGDFAVALYNPSSKRRADHLRRACDILLESRGADTLCGLVRSIGRDGQEKRLLTLAELRETEVDMVTTVFVGSSTTKNVGGYLVTPRGYHQL
ncbi:MAG: precorrin-3B C(17)-methyltransferase [Oscillospiraceae bacterium]|nr:precorrin-3B C(17)-methyltransferase [Oscillospiraceae bacterium]